MPHIELRASAGEDSRRIVTDLARQSQAAAEQLESRVVEVMGILGQFPQAGRLAYPTGDAEYRSAAVGSYLVWYRLDPTDVVRIVAIRHGRQRPLTLAELEERTEQS